MMEFPPILTGWSQFKHDDNIKNILVTGGLGFIGSWLVRHLVVNYPEYNIICFDNYGYCAAEKNISILKSKYKYTYVNGDITNPEHVSSAIETYDIDTIIHLAAESHVDHSFGNPYKFTLTNALGTQVILESAKKYAIKRLVHMSTDEVYGEVNSNEKDLIESSILIPTNPYAASKASGDLLVCAYIKSFNLPALIIRCNNVYGPHQFPEKIIPKFICLLNRGKKCFLHGDGTNTRRYIYAADAVSAIDTVLHKGEVGHIYNAGTMDELSNIEVLKSILRIFGVKENEPIDGYVEFTKDRPFNDSRYAIDSAKLQNLGWNCKTTFKEGLKITFDWYLKYGETWWGDISGMLKAFPDPVEEGRKEDS